jgi:cytochrome oxidase Cu insertion factor (SCO1/SenC/PrrC family)
MMLRFNLIYGAVISCLVGSTALGQGFGASPPLPGERGGERVRRIFDETSPKIGAPLPDVTCYDADGNEIKLRSLRGHHTVLLFGCLT